MLAGSDMHFSLRDPVSPYEPPSLPGMRKGFFVLPKFKSQVTVTETSAILAGFAYSRSSLVELFFSLSFAKIRRFVRSCIEWWTPASIFEPAYRQAG